ncbi:MAG: preprotein translocase subunit SecG [Pirellulaceae bacterium]|nr:preprotein translocase subunit SecG [Pirellulaceae bacterium]
MTTLFWFLLFFSSVFMMMLILIQRGRGGGITGALGGAGGQSAFGSKTGDVFTKITVYTAITWIMLSILTISCINRPDPPSATPLDRAGSMSEAGVDEGTELSDLLDAGDAPGELPPTELPAEDELPNQNSDGVDKKEDAADGTDPPLEQPPVTDGADAGSTENGSGSDSSINSSGGEQSGSDKSDG